MSKDKRVKRCTCNTCERNYKKIKYKAEDMFCSLCATPLVFVCSDCLDTKIEDLGPEHRICRLCEAKREDRKEKTIEYAKIVAGAVPAAVNVVKDVDFKTGKEVVKNLGKTAIKVVKK